MSRDLSLLHPKLRAIIPKIIEECAAQGLPVLVTDGMRTEDEQNALYAKGRTAPGSIVTNVLYPDSMHNWGVAFDFCRNVKGREYDDTDNFFFRVAYIAKSFGLDWGGDWTSFRDKPHLQLAEYSLDGTTAYLKRMYGTPEQFIKTWPTTSATTSTTTPAIQSTSTSVILSEAKDLKDSSAAPQNDRKGEAAPQNDRKGSKAGFADVPEDAWYAEALEWAVKKGVIAGFEDGTFHPDETLTRAQIVSMFFRFDAGQSEKT